jgi:hypothetical protein
VYPQNWSAIQSLLEGIGSPVYDRHEGGESRGKYRPNASLQSIFNALESPSLTPILKALIIESSLPLKSVETDFACDSSGFATSRSFGGSITSTARLGEGAQS